MVSLSSRFSTFRTGLLLQCRSRSISLSPRYAQQICALMVVTRASLTVEVDTQPFQASFKDFVENRAQPPTSGKKFVCVYTQTNYYWYWCCFLRVAGLWAETGIFRAFRRAFLPSRATGKTGTTCCLLKSAGSSPTPSHQLPTSRHCGLT